MKKYIVYMMCILLGIAYMTGCTQSNLIEKEIIPVEAEWTLDQITGTDTPVLDYASQDRVIFHGYFGLFVYDLGQDKIIRSIDLKSLNCHYTQGDGYCEVSVDEMGDIVQFHRMDSDEMYIYDIEKNTLKQTVYAPMENKFKTSPSEQPQSGRSLDMVEFDDGEVGYLEDRTTTLDGMYYVVGDEIYKLFR